MHTWIRFLYPSFMLLLACTLIFGGIYPLIVTGLGQLLFPFEANGSILIHNQKAVGSTLIGQFFNTPDYFWGRPSATEGFPYNTSASGGSNLSNGNPQFLKSIEARVKQLKAMDPKNREPIPVDLITASGSGLDPHISLQAIHYQAPRVAKARRLPLETIENLISAHTEKRKLGLLGEPVLNVLNINLTLDQQTKGN